MTRRCVEPLEIRRLLAGAAIDLAFGTAGINTTPNIWGNAFVVHRTASGKVVMAGSGSGLETEIPGFQNDPFVARFNSDGTLDTSFDGDGILTIAQNDGGFVSTCGGAVGPDGKIYLLSNYGD